LNRWASVALGGWIASCLTASGLGRTQQSEAQSQAIERRALMRPSAATRNRITLRIAPLITAVEPGWRRLLQWIVAIKHRRDVVHLAEPNDHLLKDVGLTRDDVISTLSEPFWRDPTALLADRAAERTRRKTFVRSVAGGAVSAGLLMAAYGSAPAKAEEVPVLSGAATQSVFKEIAGDFERPVWPRADHHQLRGEARGGEEEQEDHEIDGVSVVHGRGLSAAGS
jgi:uncharacterized protein YjiS (DUF1127 family)